MVFFLSVVDAFENRNGIDPAGPQRIASEQSQNAENGAENESVSLDCLVGILRTGRIVPAARRKKRGYAPHIEFYHFKSIFTHQ